MGSTWLREADREQIWDLHSQGFNTNEIAPMVGRAYSSVATVIKATGGIRPARPRRSTLRLLLPEREEISRGISMKETSRSSRRESDDRHQLCLEKSLPMEVVVDIEPVELIGRLWPGPTSQGGEIEKMSPAQIRSRGQGSPNGGRLSRYRQRFVRSSLMNRTWGFPTRPSIKLCSFERGASSQLTPIDCSGPDALGAEPSDAPDRSDGARTRTWSRSQSGRSKPRTGSFLDIGKAT
jgi:hypothetical protein